jgi:AcrR family transcriptional regulator
MSAKPCAALVASELGTGVSGRRSPTEAATSGSLRRQVSRLQRARLMNALVEVCCEEGPDAATVVRIAARAGFSRRTFYDLFSDRHACFLAALEDAVGRAREAAKPAYTARQGWSDKLRSGLWGLFEFLEARPQLAEFCFAPVDVGGPLALRYRAMVLSELVDLVEDGRAVARRPPPPLMAEALVRGAVGIVHRRIVEEADEPLTGLVNELMAIIVLPYLGRAQAEQELHRPYRRPRRRSSREIREQDAQVPLRLTHRTLFVLSAIAAEPGMSNRRVAHAAAISDEGQVSKLLRRLARLGLVHNSGAGHAMGRPNAWFVTDPGSELLKMLAAPAMKPDPHRGSAPG